MTEQTEITLAAKLAEVANEVSYVQKDAKNDFHKYSYASAEAVLRKVNEALTTRKIAISSNAELLHFEEGNAIVRLTLKFVDGDNGEILVVQGLGQGQDKGDKAVMKANTAALKYAYANAFTMSWGDDPEADAATDRSTTKKTSKPRAKKSGKTEKGFKTMFTMEEISSAIASSKTMTDLEQVKPRIITMRGTAAYESLRSEYKSRANDLKEIQNG